MSKYDGIDKETIIGYSDLETKYREMQVKMVDDEIFDVPNEEIERKRCKLLIDAYTILHRYEDDIKKDYAELEPYPIILDKDEKFIRASYHLCSVYHQDIREIEDFFGKQEKDWSELRKYLHENLPLEAFNIITRELVIQRSAKDYARIALIIYKSPTWNKKYKDMTFGEWYKIFCSIVECTYDKNYKLCKVSPQEKAYKDLEPKFGLLYSPNLTKSPKIPF